MTVTLTFKPDVEAGLLAQAQVAGMTVEQYLLFMVEGILLPAAQICNRQNNGQPLLSRGQPITALPLLSPIMLSAAKPCMRAAIVDAHPGRYEYPPSPCAAESSPLLADRPGCLEALTRKGCRLLLSADHR